MTTARIAGGLLFVAVITGCHVRPLPEDVLSAFNSAQIVKQIRCEAREAINILAWEEVRRIRKSFAEANEDNPRKYELIWELYQTLPEWERTNFKQYNNAIIANTFDFDIVETNNLSGGIDLQGGFRRGLTKDIFNANNDRIRRNNQTFKVTDTAQGLYFISDDFCLNQLKNEEWIYPISGKIGLLKVFRNFFDLNETKDIIAYSQVDSYTEVITFTTRLGGNVTPTWILGALGRGTNVVGADFTIDNRREDVHKLTTTVTLPKPKESKGTQKQRTQEENKSQADRTKPMIFRFE